MQNSVINQVLLAVIGMAKAVTSYNVVIGALPANESISFAIGAGAPQTTFQSKSKPYELDIVVNGKSFDPEAISDALNNIHKALTMTKTYPSTAQYQITDIDTISTPNYLSLEENGQTLYASSIRVKFWLKNI